MKILIIGGTGTISKAIADAAVSANYDVTLVNRGNSSFRNNKLCKVVTGDIYKLQELDNKLREEFYDVIVDPITYSLEELKNRLWFYKKHCKLYVFISSVAAIGSGNGIQDERSQKNPVWSYGINKLACENFLKEQHELTYMILRPSITYGDIRIPIPVACRKNPYTVIDRIKNEKPLVCFRLSDDENRKHKLMDVRDFGTYSVALLNKVNAQNNDFIICADKAYSWNEAYDALYNKLNKKKCVYEVDRDAFKVLDSALYDDLTYDKDAANVLYSKEKCIQYTGLNIRETELEEGISNLVDYLEKVYKNRLLEEEYNLMSDYLLLHYAKRDDTLNKYLNTFTDEYKNKLNNYYKNKIIQIRKNRSFLYRGYRIAKKILNKLFR